MKFLKDYLVPPHFPHLNIRSILIFCWSQPT